MRWIVVPSFLMINFLFGACVSVEGLKVDSSFTHSEIKKQGLIIGGVIESSKVPNFERSQKFSRLLEKKIVNEREEFKVVVNAAAKNMDEKAYGEILKRFAKADDLADQDYATLKKDFPENRYFVMALIEENKVSKNVSESTEEKAEEITVTYQTTRSININFSVVDLNKEKKVWSGAIRQSLSDTNEYKRPKKEDALNTIVKHGLGIKEEKKSYPDAPPEEKVMGEVFEVFANKLPED